MALGATFKIGMDTTAVRRGLANIKGMFRGLKGTAMGLSKSKGAFGLGGIFGAVTGMLTGQAVAKVAELGSEFSDLEVQTQTAGEKLLKLSQIMRIAGAPADNLMQSLGQFSRNLGEARKGSGPVQDAINDLGLGMQDLEGMDLFDAFMKIMDAAARSGKEATELARIFAQIFSMRTGGGFVRVALDLENSIKKSERQTSNWVRTMASALPYLDDIWDIMGSIKNFMQAGLVKALQQLQPQFEALKETFEAMQDDPLGFVRDMASFIGGEVSKLTSKVMEWVHKGLAPVTSGISAMLDFFQTASNFQAIGAAIGEGIAEVVGKGIRNQFPTLFRQEMKKGVSNEQIENFREATKTLKRIDRTLLNSSPNGWARG